jgi:hypothetical protein
VNVIYEIIANNVQLFLLILSALFLCTFMVLLILLIRVNNISSKYKKLVTGVEGKNLEEAIFENGRTIERALLEVELFKKRLKDIEAVTEKSIQKIGFVRFNAFQEMGGEMSYSLALLDRSGDGIVISSIYGREDARTYCKTLTKGATTYNLSDEEKQAIVMALKSES